jgi:cell wall-associated NlpC family hydrolase
MIKILAPLMIGLTIGGCSLTPTNTWTNHPYPAEQHAKLGTAEASNIRSALLQQYRKWRGAPYRTGGLGKDGIDCSGFVYLTFHQQLGIPIPRTTAQQVSLGQL